MLTRGGDKRGRDKRGRDRETEREDMDRDSKQAEAVVGGEGWEGWVEASTKGTVWPCLVLSPTACCLLSRAQKVK